MICNFPSLSLFTRKMIFMTAHEKKMGNSRKSFNSSLKMSKSFTSHNLLNFQHNSRPLNDADRMTERKSLKRVFKQY